jgi:trk system potassium uptake protein TrkA
MRVLILGGGQVGALIARRLISERNEITIVEQSEERCAELEAALDVKVIRGSASRIDVLQRAGLQEADMLIAVTQNDEANILGCLIAQTLSKVKVKLMRLRTHQVDLWRSICGTGALNVDLVIHPDGETAQRILRVVGLPGISEIYEFADGQVKLFGMNIEDRSWLAGKTLQQLAESAPAHALIPMIFRGHEAVIPRGDDEIRAGDHVYVLAPSGELERVYSLMEVPPQKKIERVFIVGGKQIGIEVALRLEREGVQVKLFERDMQRCELISRIVRKTMVVHGDGTEQRVLAEENIDGIDAYLALTGDDEGNIIASLLARRLGARKAVARVNRLDLMPMAQMLGLNSIFNSRLVVVDRILQFVRQGKVLSVTTFRNEEVEAIELLATAESKYVGRPVRHLHLPRGVIVGAIARPTGEVIVPRGDTVIEPGDRAVFFCLEQLVPELESAFIAERQRTRM